MGKNVENKKNESYMLVYDVYDTSSGTPHARPYDPAADRRAAVGGAKTQGAKQLLQQRAPLLFLSLHRCSSAAHLPSEYGLLPTPLALLSVRSGRSSLRKSEFVSRHRHTLK